MNTLSYATSILGRPLLRSALGLCRAYSSAATKRRLFDEIWYVWQHNYIPFKGCLCKHTYSHSCACTTHTHTHTHTHTQGSFSHGLLLNFARKGAPSPGTSALRSSSSSTTHPFLHDTSSTKSFSLMFSDTCEQGIFHLADSFSKHFLQY